jgi:hypothetical protein
MSQQEKDRLFRIHELRWKSHWGKKYDISLQPWPKTDADWRQTDHGAPWDSNVMMAKWHLEFARTLFKEGLTL